MVSIPDDSDSQSRSLHGTPSHQTLDLPRIPSASKGGCWTCRLRRKKCDEQRQGDSCRTCIRLTIKCLGWGPKRPDWMRDKQAVEAYKADIKAQLTRAGLIRGQPRSSLIRASSSSSLSSALVPPQQHQGPYRNGSTPDTNTPPPHHFDQTEYGYSYLDPLQRRHRNQDHGNVIPTLTAFHQVPDYTDSTFSGLDLHTPYFSYPQSITPISSSSDSLNLDFSHLGGTQDPSTFEFDLRPPSPPAPSSFPVGQSNVQEHIIYYFEHVRKIQLIFAGNTFTNATYSAIVQEPTGAVTNAVCALASLHYNRKRVAEGLEAPDPNPEHSYAMYFHNEANFQLNTAKHLRHPNETDALAALHLITFSQLSGGVITAWQPAFQIMCDWLATTGLFAKDNPALSLHNLSSTTQFLVKATLWFDTLASITQIRQPKYLGLLKNLLNGQGGYWSASKDADEHRFLRMDLVTGCPDGAMLALAEIAMLAHWKATEQRNRTLSYRELITRGDDIEHRLRQHQSCTNLSSDVDQDPLHPGVPHMSAVNGAAASYPDEKARSLVSKLFYEVAVLLLNAVLSNANPGALEIRESIERTVQLLKQFVPSELDRALVFPIFLAGSMSDDRNHRDLCKSRFKHLDGGVGNVMQILSVMEGIWRKRDITGGTVDFRETLRDQNINLLLI